MATITSTQTLPAPFITAAAEEYFPMLASAIGGIKGLDYSQIFGPQFVAPESQYQTQAQQLASGLGGYQQYLDAAKASTGPDAYKQYMSPYQQEVINTTLQNFDLQAQRAQQGNAAQAITAGAFGGGREGVERANYGALSDMNRAGINANLLQQGFTTANQLAQQNYANQLGLAGQSQGLLGQQIAGLTALGAQQQAQKQAELTAQQQLLQKQAFQPLEAAQLYGAGIAPLIAGYPGKETTMQQPSPSGLQTALSVAGTLASIYGKLKG